MIEPRRSLELARRTMHAVTPARAGHAPVATGLALVATLLLSGIAAASTDGGATITVRDALQEATAVSKTEQTHEQQLEDLRSLARQLVDTHAMGRRAIGTVLTDQPAAQQQEFLRLFDELIVRAYLQKLLLFRDPKFRFRPEDRHGDVVMVVTEVVTGKDTYEVAYEMRQQDERWLATDIVVEGISLTSSYTDQFASALKTRSFDELLDLLRRKVDHFRAPTTEPAAPGSSASAVGVTPAQQP